MSKIGYLLKSAANYPFPAAHRCPNCGGKAEETLDQKYVVTQLVRCANCKLMYRTPTDSERFSHAFYNSHYVEGDAMICPSEEEIVKLKATNFGNTDRDFTGYITFLDRYDIRPPQRILDFGCSWGYGSYQFAEAGFDTYSFEIATNRRNYGIKNLGVRHLDDIFELDERSPFYETFDCFFSAHVLEHVPMPSRVIELAWRCLKPGGAFVAFTPNGCSAFRQNNPKSWSNMWGEVHPNYLDDIFYKKHFSHSQLTIAARDGKNVMQQYELGIVARKDPMQRSF